MLVGRVVVVVMMVMGLLVKVVGLVVVDLLVVLFGSLLKLCHFLW